MLRFRSFADSGKSLSAVPGVQAWRHQLVLIERPLWKTCVAQKGPLGLDKQLFSFGWTVECAIAFRYVFSYVSAADWSLPTSA